MLLATSRGSRPCSPAEAGRISETLGLTVAVGSPYAELAPLAAQCFSEHTGIPAVVFGEEELRTTDLPHPAALRLLAFDILPANRLVYFDADWLCLRPWIPYPSSDTQLRACRDFILMDEFPRQHYDFNSPAFLAEPEDRLPPDAELRHDLLREVVEFASIRLPYSQWINSGLLVLHRDPHAQWFGRALSYYLGEIGHHRVYFEQPALVRAIEHLESGVRLLPSSLNVLAAHPATWPPAVTGLHVKLKRHGMFLDQVRAGVIRKPQDVRAYFVSDRYVRMDQG